jgi:4'-phosphopantetheinyl transferase
MAEIYNSPREHPRLVPAVAHVWRAGIAPDSSALSEMVSVLAADERSRAERFHFDHHRERYIAARATLRRLLGAYAHVAPEEIVFRYGERGKPAVEAPAAAAEIDFNVSHRGDFALYVFCRGRELGIDIEFVRDVPQALAIGRKHFTPEESRLLVAADAEGKILSSFFRLWTRKEAVIKAVGTGLAMPLTEFDVSSAAADGAAWHSVQIPARPNTVWSVRDLFPLDGYRGALCLSGTPLEIEFWTGDDP